jgi:hypothetical protein
MNGKALRARSDARDEAVEKLKSVTPGLNGAQWREARGR